MSLNTKNRLPSAIERLYEAFADAPKPRHICGCVCCIQSKDVQSLITSPLRNLSGHILTPHLASSMVSAGAVSDFLYFLPRLLEIADDDVVITGGAIGRTNPESWSPTRRRALRSFLHAAIEASIQSDELRYRLDAWVCAIAKMGVDVRPFLHQIAKSPEAILEFFDANAGTLPHNRLSSAFWDPSDPAYEQILEWFKSEPVRKIPFAAYGYLM